MAGAAITHFEIHVDDLERAKQFYAELFGWEFIDSGMEGYWLIGTGRSSGANGQPAGIDGGMVKRNAPTPDMKSPPNAFACTILVDDIAATVAKAKELGATETTDQMDIPDVGLWHGLRDPDGNHIGVMQGAQR